MKLFLVTCVLVIVFAAKVHSAPSVAGGKEEGNFPSKYQYEIAKLMVILEKSGLLHEILGVILTAIERAGFPNSNNIYIDEPDCPDNGGLPEVTTPSTNQFMR